MSKLKTIEEHEQEFLVQYKISEGESRCGIQCPTCGEELYVDNTCILTSNPPQRRIYCKKCKFIGSIH